MISLVFLIIAGALVVFLFGLFIGTGLTEERWCRKGDHPYMKTIKSNGKTYIVREVVEDFSAGDFA